VKVLFLRVMESLRFIYLFNFMSFLLVPKERTKEKAPHEPALRVRSLAWKIRAAAQLASLEQEPLSPRISLHSLTGFRGDQKQKRPALDFCFI
jgi:hypothetical protein